MIRRIPRVALFLTVLVALSAQAADTESYLRQHENYLASPARDGRGIGTRGLDSAAAYIAAQMKSIGLKPAFDTSYFQPFEMGWGVRLGPENFLRADTARLDTGSGVMPVGFSSAGTATGTIVFAGYGIIAPEYNYDDFAQIDATGKIVICFTAEPGEFDSTSKFEGTNYTTHSALRVKAGNAKLKGAVGLLIVEGPIYAGKDKHQEILAAPRADEPYSDCGIPVARITRAAFMKLFPKFDLETIQQLIDGKTEPRSIDVDTTHVTLRVDLTRKTVQVKNVVGVFPGDSSIIVVGAHYDHLGYGQSGSLESKPGKLHPGADDNGSGTSSIIEIARLLKDHPIRETVVVAAFTAEETGLGGSNHLVKNFPGGFNRVRMMLNLDMVGRMKDNKITVQGCKTAEQFPEIVAAANKEIGLDVTCKGDGYGPSDNMSFYMADKPVLYLFTGVHEDYHRSTDTPDKIDYRDMTRVVQLAVNLVHGIDDYTSPLTFVKTSEAPKEGSGRLRSSLGSVPDFSQADSLKGYLIGDVKPEGAAQKAGLLKGDLVTQVGKVSIGNIYDLMNALRIYAPGDTVDVAYVRNGKSGQSRAVLQQSTR